jgi:hypothetical protein
LGPAVNALDHLNNRTLSTGDLWQTQDGRSLR